MKLNHIDNSFFKLTPHQARELSIDGELPSHGCEKKVDRAKLATVELFSGCKQWDCKATEAASAWVTRTITNEEQTLALRLYFSPSF